MMSNIALGLIIAFLSATLGSAIQCYRCNSTFHRECLEKFIYPSTLRPESCSDVFEARYCIKTTGIYDGDVGDKRFCSARDLGNYCEYIRREGDDREFRSCVYTCDTNACNSAPAVMSPLLTMIAVLLCAHLLRRHLSDFVTCSHTKENGQTSEWTDL